MIARLTAALLLVLVASAGAAPIAVTVDPPEPPIGSLVAIRVDRPGATGVLGGEALGFFTVGGASIALVGIDLDREPGPLALRLLVGDQAIDRVVVVRDKRYPEERLVVAKGFTELDARTLERVEREAARLDAIWQGVTAERLWSGRFALPVKAAKGSPFGLRRFFNGEPRSPHSGLDFRAGKGTPVHAPNRGRVVLVADLYFSGKTVVLDHGLGLFTSYLHLSAADVREGQVVARGQGLGRVGATGRATGPHLHFGVRLGSARVDPESVLERRLD